MYDFVGLAQIFKEPGFGKGVWISTGIAGERLRGRNQ
jgi:hypothetical protein